MNDTDSFNIIPFLIFAASILILWSVVVIIPFYVRRMRMRALAKSLKLTYSTPVWYRGLFEFATMPLLTSWENQHKRNFIKGEIEGRKVEIYDVRDNRHSIGSRGSWDFMSTDVCVDGVMTTLSTPFSMWLPSIAKIRRTLREQHVI